MVPLRSGESGAMPQWGWLLGGSLSCFVGGTVAFWFRMNGSLTVVLPVVLQVPVLYIVLTA
jgi:hypothetical protein